MPYLNGIGLFGLPGAEQGLAVPKKNVFLVHPKRASIQIQGRRIGALRDALNLSNRDLATLTGIPEPTLSQYVHGRKMTISAYHIWRIASATGVTSDYLIAGERRGVPPELIGKLYPEKLDS
jgi:DNA-binding transcriptional regulator YiaG